jgi:large subunit ribosomal protein L25
MLQVEMSASVRTTTGKGAMRRLRSEGMTPAVVYGAGAEAQALQMSTKSLMAILLDIYRKNAVVTLKIDGAGDRSVTVKEVQTDPVKDTLIHADFCEIDLEKEHKFSVPLEFVGLAKGVDLGGNLEKYANAVELQGKPLDIPNELTLDIAGLNIGDKLTFSAVTLPENVSMVSNPDAACVAVVK